MTDAPPTRRRSVAARRAGYAFGVVVNVALLYAVHGWPGWRELPFLTEDTTQVLGAVTAALVAGLVTNVVYLASDPPWLTALGDLVITVIGLVALVRVWQVFPLDFGDHAVNWAMVARVLLVIAMGGSVIGVFAQLAALVRFGAGPARTVRP